MVGHCGEVGEAHRNSLDTSDRERGEEQDCTYWTYLWQKVKHLECETVKMMAATRGSQCHSIDSVPYPHQITPNTRITAITRFFPLSISISVSISVSVSISISISIRNNFTTPCS